MTDFFASFISLLQVKCDQYWPNRGQETYGQVQVTLLDITELATYTVRTFALVNLKVSMQSCSFINIIV